MGNCCNLVGNFSISAPGIISITSQGSTEATLVTANGSNVAIVSPTSGSVSLTAYAGTERYIGCPGRAGVTVPWIIRNNCDDLTYLFGGAGKSYISGEVGSYAKFPTIVGVTNPLTSYNVISASASSGPAALVEDSIQYDGYGLIYSGYPWSMNTITEGGCMVNLTSYGIGGYGTCRLQNINIQCIPGQIPIVNMSFIYTISN